jgi:hypothetical protein
MVLRACYGLLQTLESEEFPRTQVEEQRRRCERLQRLHDRLVESDRFSI